MRAPAYRIETARLVLRCWNPEDAPLLEEAVLSSLDHLRPWMPWVQQEPESIDVRRERLRRFRGQFDLNLDFVYGIFSKDETRVIGGTGLHTRQGPEIREIGYWIREDSVNSGYATETAAALTRVAFEVEGVPRVEIRCDTRNTFSARIPQILGFTLEQTIPDGQQNRDLMIWGLRLEDYPVSAAASARIRAFDVIGRDFEL